MTGEVNLRGIPYNLIRGEYEELFGLIKRMVMIQIPGPEP
jgi:hypothetical protein